MDNLEQLSQELMSLSALLDPDKVQLLKLAMTNGVNTLTSRIEFTQQALNKDNHELFGDINYFHSVEGQKYLNELKQALPLDVKGRLENLIWQDDFIEQWQKISNKEKEEFIYFDKSIYGILRQKLDTKDFDFMFSELENKEVGGIPMPLAKWIHEANSISFGFIFKPNRKHRSDPDYQDFFHDPRVLAAESKKLDQSARIEIVKTFLKERAQNPYAELSWYERLDMSYEKHWVVAYTYHFLKEQEDALRGYDKIQEQILQGQIQIPTLLQEWAGLNFDFEAHKRAVIAFEKSCEGLSEAERQKRFNEHPEIIRSKKEQQGISSEEFLAWQKRAQGTELEEFFSLEMTNKMKRAMPYKRIDYMFVYFRDDFMQAFSKKLKL